MEQQSYPVGWYECENGKWRYWDGQNWTVHGPLPAHKPWYRKWWFFAIIGVVVLAVVIGLLGPGVREDKSSRPVPTATAPMSQDEKFFKAWEQLPDTDVGPSSAKIVVVEICNRLDGGASVYTVWQQLLSSGFTPTEAGYFLGGAGTVYCPQYKDTITKELENR